MFHVTGLGVLDRHADDGSFVVDKRGGEHAVTLHESADGVVAHLTYLTRAPGARTWARTRVATAYEADPIQGDVTAFLSTDG
jgi:hypothetical protein